MEVIMDDIRKLGFELMTELCIAGGGDGDAAIVSEYYKKWADEYEIWINEKYPNMYTRLNGDDYITFTCMQETIWFVEKEKRLPKYVDNRLVHPWL